MSIRMRTPSSRFPMLGLLLGALACPADACATSPRRLVEVVDLASPAISPDGTVVAFRHEQASIERNTYDTVWYVQRMDGPSPPVRVADGGVTLRDTAGNSIPPTVVWSPDSRWIFYRALVDGRIGVWRAAADGSRAEPVTEDPADVRTFSLSTDGRTLWYSVGATREEVMAAEEAEYDRGIRIDESVPVGQGLFRSISIGGRLETQRYNGQWFDREPLLARIPDRWKAVDVATRKTRAAQAPDVHSPPVPGAKYVGDSGELWKSAPEPGGGRRALLIRHRGPGQRGGHPAMRLLVVRGSANSRLECAVDLCTNKPITDVQWRPGTDEVLFTLTDPAEGFAQSIHAWDTSTGEVRTVVRARGLINGGRDERTACGVSAAFLACVAADPDRPPRLESIDLETGRRHVLYNPNQALDLDIRTSTPSRMLTWTDEHGTKFTGQFFAARSTGDAPAPLFATYYRCSGFMRGGIGDEWPLASLAASGISALCINAPPHKPNAVERFDEALSAMKSVVDLLASKGEVDRAAVGMGGLSFGTEATMWVVMKSDLLAAASISSPSVTPNYYTITSLKGDASLDALRKSWQVGDPAETAAQWRTISPTFHLDSMRTPILMQLPEQEYMLTVDYSIPLLRDRRVDLYVYPEEPHLKYQPRHKLAVYERNVDWFRYWLQGHEDPDPAKSEQYAYWSSMRSNSAAK